jgi:single-stranded DNA-binding protein
MGSTKTRTVNGNKLVGNPEPILLIGNIVPEPTLRDTRQTDDGHPKAGTFTKVFNASLAVSDQATDDPDTCGSSAVFYSLRAWSSSRDNPGNPGAPGLGEQIYKMLTRSRAQLRHPVLVEGKLQRTRFKNRAGRWTDGQEVTISRLSLLKNPDKIRDANKRLRAWQRAQERMERTLEGEPPADAEPTEPVADWTEAPNGATAPVMNGEQAAAEVEQPPDAADYEIPF